MANTSTRYSVVARYFAEDDGFIATVEEFPGISAFGATREEAIRELEVALEATVEEYEEAGWPLPEPVTARSPLPQLPSGEFRARLPRSVHLELANRAKQEGVSLNTLLITYVVSCLHSQPSARGRDTSGASAIDFTASQVRTESIWETLERTFEELSSRRDADAVSWDGPTGERTTETWQDLKGPHGAVIN